MNSPSGERSQVAAVLDVGSNTVRLLVAQLGVDGLQPLCDNSQFVRLGDGVHASGRLSRERMDLALRAIEELLREARMYAPRNILGIATSAVREAENGAEFVDRVERATGLRIEIVSGGREARLTYLGATLRLNVKGETLVADLGGGSLELVSAEEGAIRWEASLPLGAGRLSELFVRSDPPTPEELAAVREHVISSLQQQPSARPDTLIYTGGTARHVEHLAGGHDGQAPLSSAALDEVVRLLLGTSWRDLAVAYRVKAERAEVLPAGAAALQAISNFYHPRETLVTVGGIREGALLDVAAKNGQLLTKRLR